MKTIRIRGRILAAVALAAIAVIVLLQCVTVVPTGHAGILTTFGKVADYTLGSGFHLKGPVQNIILMDVREQKTPFTTQSFSSDIQQVDIIGSINYAIDETTAMKLYSEVGTQYFSTLLMPRLLENTTAVFSKHTAENLVAAREELSVTIREKLSQELAGYGIHIISLSIENIDFTDSFTDAVEAKQVAAQRKLQAEIEQEQATMEARQAAERKRIAAEADAAVEKINADAAAYTTRVKAEAEAEANSKVAASLTETLVTYRQTERWDGRLPAYMNGSGGFTLPILDLKEE